jgi:hypothetical protein
MSLSHILVILEQWEFISEPTENSKKMAKNFNSFCTRIYTVRFASTKMKDNSALLEKQNVLKH